MIIIKLKGGLGNQLFEYACGRALLLRQQEKEGRELQLKLDTTGYGENNGIDTIRRYSLSPFNIHAEIATQEEIRKLKYHYGIISKCLRFFRAKVLRQFNVGFNPRIFNTQGSVYLDGFFQTENYFRDKEEEIRADFTLKNPLSGNAEEMSETIKRYRNSVSIHVRRGDYVNDPNTNKYWGTCSIEYYLEALKYIASNTVGDINVFVFSDDIEWVKKNLSIPYQTIYVSSPELADYEELALMSMCGDNVISNSSFSWWGGWLNNDPNKIVVAPRQWTKKDSYSFNDVVPTTWIRI